VAFVPAAEGKLKPMKIVTDLLGVVAIGLLAWSPVYFVAATTAANVQQIATVNHSVNLAFRIVLVIVVIGMMKDVWKYAKRSKPLRQLAF
jgi:membrane protein DedA with SNARE-associated domain